MKREEIRKYRKQGESRSDHPPWRRDYWEVLKSGLNLKELSNGELLTKLSFFCRKPLLFRGSLVGTGNVWDNFCREVSLLSCPRTVTLSWLMIVVYLWFRFVSVRWGLAAAAPVKLDHPVFRVMGPWTGEIAISFNGLTIRKYVPLDDGSVILQFPARADGPAHVELSRMTGKPAAREKIRD